jgi:hypothetical protein
MDFVRSYFGTNEPLLNTFVFNWSEVHFYRSNFLQNPYFSDLKSFSRSLEFFFFTVGQNNFGNKIPFFTFFFKYLALTNLFGDSLSFIWWQILTVKTRQSKKVTTFEFRTKHRWVFLLTFQMLLFIACENK